MSKQLKLVFIVNPIAGNGCGSKVVQIIHNYFKYYDNFKIKVEVSEHDAHTSEIAIDYREKNYDIIVAVGGDGTVNEVARQLVGSTSKLGIIPIGSGNGLARHLGIPRDVNKAIQIILGGHVKNMDTGVVNNHYFFCTCGVGFDARIGALFAEADERGFKTYFKTTVKEFLHYKPKKYKLKIDGEKIRQRVFLVTFANASQYGNNAYIAPLASTTDGLIDVSILKQFPVITVPLLGWRLFTKRIHKSKYMSVYRGEKITLKRKKEGEVHIDGEPLMLGKKIKLSILPAKLNVIVPGTI